MVLLVRKRAPEVGGFEIQGVRGVVYGEGEEELRGVVGWGGRACERVRAIIFLLLIGFRLVQGDKECFSTSSSSE
jgi:hypothetical protein